MYYMTAVPIEATKGHQILRNWSSKPLDTDACVLQIKPGPLEEQTALLTTEPCLRYPCAIVFIGPLVSPSRRKKQYFYSIANYFLKEGKAKRKPVENIYHTEDWRLNHKVS